jgi:hypothetical protein
MNPVTRVNQAPYRIEEIRHVNKCIFSECPDDIIADPDGMTEYCFKHYNYTDR